MAEGNARRSGRSSHKPHQVQTYSYSRKPNSRKRPASLKQARFIEMKGGTSLWNEASFSAQTGRFRGGTCIVLSPKMAKLVTSHGILYPGMAQYVVLQISPALQLGVINIYGFSHTGPRAMMWAHLTQTQLPEAQWVLAGDFNNIESINDKQGGSTKTNISNKELEAWNKLLLKLGVRDTFHMGTYHRKNQKAYTWSNYHEDETMIQTRIDRIYLPYQLEQRGGVHRDTAHHTRYLRPCWSCISHQELTQEESSHSHVQQRTSATPGEQGSSLSNLERGDDV